MSKYTGHYLKPAKRCYSPSAIFGVAVETEDKPASFTRQYMERKLTAVAACFTCKRNGKWSRPITIETSDCNGLRKWMGERAHSDRRNYVIGEIASEFLTLTQWWNYAESRGIEFVGSNGSDKSKPLDVTSANRIKCRRCILRGLPDIFDISDKGKRYIYLSGRQYINDEEKAIGESIGFRPEETLFTLVGNASQSIGLINRAVLWSQLLCQLSNWWSENATAPFGLTLGSMAMGILRSYTKPKILTTHSDDYVHKLERIASYGGRASLWYVGSVGNAPVIPVHWQSRNRQRNDTVLVDKVRLVDVRSMYPYLLRERSYPARYAGRIGPVSPAELQSLSKHYGTIAKVFIYSDSGEYPYRTAKGVTYPRGYFNTVLSGPEINSISGKDRILKVYDGATYYLASPFKEAANALLEMRLKAREERRQVWEIFAKSVGNNLGGKLAQRRTIWKPRPDIAPKRDWGEWIESFPDEEKAIRFRSIARMVFEYVKDDGGYGPYTASFAYLTAYGRLHMRNLRSLLPTFSVLSQDTDGIWVIGEEPYQILRDKCVFSNDPGTLNLKHEASDMVFLSPRHYYADGIWTLAGFHNPTVDVSRMEVCDTYVTNPLTVGTRSAPQTVLVQQRLSKLVLEHIGGEIQPNGWVNPLYIPPPKDYCD